MTEEYSVRMQKVIDTNGNPWASVHLMRGDECVHNQLFDWHGAIEPFEATEIAFRNICATLRILRKKEVEE